PERFGVSPQPRQPGVAAARGGLASSEGDERLVAWVIFSWKFLGDFLERPGGRRHTPESGVASGSTARNADRTRRSPQGENHGQAPVAHPPVPAFTDAGWSETSVVMFRRRGRTFQGVGRFKVGRAAATPKTGHPLPPF